MALFDSRARTTVFVDDPRTDDGARRRMHLAMFTPLVVAIASLVAIPTGQCVADFSVSDLTIAGMAVAVAGWLGAFILPGLGRYARAEAAAQRARNPRRAQGPVATGACPVLVPAITLVIALNVGAEWATWRTGATSNEPARVVWKDRRTGKGCHTPVGVRGERGHGELRLCPSERLWTRLQPGQALVLEHRAGPWGDAVSRVDWPADVTKESGDDPTRGDAAR